MLNKWNFFELIYGLNIKNAIIEIPIPISITHRWKNHSCMLWEKMNGHVIEYYLNWSKNKIYKFNNT